MKAYAEEGEEVEKAQSSIEEERERERGNVRGYML